MSTSWLNYHCITLVVNAFNRSHKCSHWLKCHIEGYVVAIAYATLNASREVSHGGDFAVIDDPLVEHFAATMIHKVESKTYFKTFSCRYAHHCFGKLSREFTKCWFANASWHTFYNASYHTTIGVALGWCIISVILAWVRHTPPATL